MRLRLRQVFAVEDEFCIAILFQLHDGDWRCALSQGIYLQNRYGPAFIAVTVVSAPSGFYYFPVKTCSRELSTSIQVTRARSVNKKNEFTSVVLCGAK